MQSNEVRLIPLRCAESDIFVIIEMKLIKKRTHLFSEFNVSTETQFPILTLLPLFLPHSFGILISVVGFLVWGYVCTKSGGCDEKCEKSVRFVETLRVVHGVGVSIEKSDYFGMRSQLRFIELERIQDILITEVRSSKSHTFSLFSQVISTSNVVFHLVLILKNEDKLIVVFEVNHMMFKKS